MLSRLVTPPDTLRVVATIGAGVVVELDTFTASEFNALVTVLPYWSTPPPREFTVMSPLTTSRVLLVLIDRPGATVGSRTKTPSPAPTGSYPATARAVTC